MESKVVTDEEVPISSPEKECIIDLLFTYKIISYNEIINSTSSKC